MVSHAVPSAKGANVLGALLHSHQAFALPRLNRGDACYQAMTGRFRRAIRECLALAGRMVDIAGHMPGIRLNNSAYLAGFRWGVKAPVWGSYTHRHV